MKKPTKNPWIVHLNKYRKAHPTLKFTEAARRAKLTYKPKK